MELLLTYKMPEDGTIPKGITSPGTSDWREY